MSEPATVAVPVALSAVTLIVNEYAGSGDRHVTVNVFSECCRPNADIVGIYESARNVVRSTRWVRFVKLTCRNSGR